MLKIRYLYYILFIATFTACKVSKPPQPTSQIPEKIIKTDTVSSLPVDTLAVAIEIDTIKADSLIKTVVKKKDTLSVIGVGDIMLGTNFPSADYLPPNNGKDLLADVKEILNDADITFGNQEGVILNEGGIPKTCSNPDVCYLFRSPEIYVQHLVDAGFDIMSLANNHAGDFGDAGRKNTMKVLEKAGIYHAGQLAQPYVLFTKDSIRYGFTAFAPNTGTVSIHDLNGAIKIVKHLDSLSDVVIVSFHGGAEGAKFRNVTRKEEMFYGENRGNVYKFAHTLIDNGADVVFGHGPHVTRAVEIYKNRFVAYSLGNFCTYARFNLRGENGIAPIIKLYITNKGEFIEGKVIPIIQLGEGGPKIDPEKRAIKTLQELKAIDFPEVQISISDDGWIRYNAAEQKR